MLEEIKRQKNDSKARVGDHKVYYETPRSRETGAGGNLLSNRGLSSENKIKQSSASALRDKKMCETPKSNSGGGLRKSFNNVPLTPEAPNISQAKDNNNIFE